MAAWEQVISQMLREVISRDRAISALDVQQLSLITGGLSDLTADIAALRAELAALRSEIRGMEDTVLRETLSGGPGVTTKYRHDV